MVRPRYRCDVAEPQEDGAVAWYSTWIGGRTLSKVDNCRLVDMVGDMRRIVYTTSEPDTYYTIPAYCLIAHCYVRGYITDQDGQLVFRHTYRENEND